MLSIIIPVFNGEHCIATVLSDIEKVMNSIDCEVLIINDGSTDNTVEQVNNFISLRSLNNQIRIENQKNQGVQAARNKGIQLASGEYIYFADADDRLVCEQFVSFYNKTIEHEPDVQFANYIQYNIENGISKYPGARILNDYKLYDNYNLEECLHLQCIMSNRLFRRKFLIDNSLSFPNYKIGEDAYMHYTSTAMASKILTVNETIYIYNQIDGSACHTYDDRIIQIIQQFDECKDFYKNHKLERYIKELTEDRYYWYNGWMHKLLRYRSKSLRAELFDKFAYSYLKEKELTGIQDSNIEFKIKHQRLYKSELTQGAFRYLRRLKLYADSKKHQKKKNTANSSIQFDNSELDMYVNQQQNR